MMLNRRSGYRDGRDSLENIPRFAGKKICEQGVVVAVYARILRGNKIIENAKHNEKLQPVEL